MEIYTSYYANPIFRNYEDRCKYTCIQVSSSKPSWFDVDGIIQEFYPPYKLVELIKSGLITEEKYISTYKSILDNIDCVKSLNSIILKSDKPIVLLCWESPNLFCHRHILADKLNDCGYDITELTNSII